MAPTWLTVVAWLYLAVCFCCAGIIAYDIIVNRRRQPMGVMNFVFPITALYFGPLAVALYWRWGRAARMAPPPMSASPAAMSLAPVAAAGNGTRTHQHTHHDTVGTTGTTGIASANGRDGTNGRDGANGAAAPSEQAKPWWATMAIEVSHCGAGCSLGDVISEFAIFALGLTIAGLTLGAEYVGDYILALVFGIVFQYFAIAPMRGLGLRDGLIAATKADFISLTAFEIGLFGWMAIMTFVLFPAPHNLMPSSAAFWLLMQVGMIIGFCTSWPANVWLVKRGIKVPM
jgi:Domain of unknown function (DUF4396)